MSLQLSGYRVKKLIGFCTSMTLMNSGMTEIAAFRIMGVLSLQSSSYISMMVSKSPVACLVL